MASVEAGDWREGRGLLERNKYLYETQHGCDVKLKVGGGSSEKELTSHRYILSCGSEVFESLLTHWDENGSDPIVVDDVEADVFMEMMRYLYYEEVNITASNVMDLLYAAKKFLVYGLTELCSQFLQNDLSIDNVVTIINNAIKYDAKELVDSCVWLISREPKAVLESAEFLELSHESLKEVVSFDVIGKATEVDVHNACVRWAEGRCKNQGKAVTDVNQREILGDILYKIRYPTMTAQKFYQLTAHSQLLTQLERLDVYDCISSGGSRLSSMFSSTKRHSPLEVDRLQAYSQGWQMTAGVPQAIDVTCDQDILLLGVGAYGAYDARGIANTFDVDIQLLDTNQKVLTETGQVKLVTTNNHNPTNTWFKRPVRLKKNTRYTITIKSQQNFQSSCGYYGQPNVQSTGCNFTFSNPSHGGNTTQYSQQGQLPRMIFHKA